jgi:hypothetical protein
LGLKARIAFSQPLSSLFRQKSGVILKLREENGFQACMGPGSLQTTRIAAYRAEQPRMKGGPKMNAPYVNKDLQLELADMKARVKDLMRAVDEMGDGSKKIMSSQFEDLHALMEELIRTPASGAGNEPAVPGDHNGEIEDWWERRAAGWSPG